MLLIIMPIIYCIYCRVYKGSIIARIVAHAQDWFLNNDQCMHAASYLYMRHACTCTVKGW